MLSAAASDVVKHRLHVALADLHNLAGWPSFEIGLIDSARNHFGRALGLAKAGKLQLAGREHLYRMCRVYLHKEFPGRRAENIPQIAAQDDGADSELAAAVLCAKQARAYARRATRTRRTSTARRWTTPPTPPSMPYGHSPSTPAPADVKDAPAGPRRPASPR
jgi:hypothetical protein